MNNKERYHINKNYVENPIMLGEIRLFQLGRMHCSKKTIVETHIHKDWYELTSVVEGEGVIITNGTSVPIKKNQIYLSFPTDIHTIISDADKPMKFNFFSFYAENVEIKEKLEKLRVDYILPNMRIISDEKIDYLICNAIAEMNLRNEKSDRILSLIFEQIIWYTIRNFTYSVAKSQRLDANYHDELCYQLINYIDTNLYNIKDLSELSEIFSYNYSYLSTIFSQKTGGTLSDYYHNRKLELAEKLLFDGYSVTEISLKLQYSSIYSFSRAFKNKYKLSPREFIQKKGK